LNCQSNPNHRPIGWPKIARSLLPFVFAAMLVGCGSSRREVVVYTSLDKEFSGSILTGYSEKSGVTVRPKYDAESTKTVGLTNLIVSEASRPQCDLFWNNEILNTLRLKKKGLLASYHPANAADYPATFRDNDGQWYGFAARARIILVNTKLVAETDRPKSILDLADPKWKGKTAIAKPLFGTTATQAACLFAAWGDDKAKAYYKSLKANEIQVLSGNKQVAQAVGTGVIAFGMTDTDDAMEEVAAGSPVAIFYPDQGLDGLGTLFIPNTLAIIKGCPNPQRAEDLANYLLSAEVEDRLASGPSAQIPLNTKSRAKVRVETPLTVHAMPANFEKAADLWDTVAAFLAEEFGG
jgi:iron(III) transport system substrate-binding protein